MVYITYINQPHLSSPQHMCLHFICPQTFHPENVFTNM
ncbi:unnamed protein product [Brassica napus]|uniref:(rape) hypothetical protein n=1 Tax=Brassica napus TaxID=3708 RepID=A0A816KNR5_BRANA|nr:unnamed protein product [Brassica napus]